MVEAVHLTLGRRLANARHSCAPWLFAREMLTEPAVVGAIWPSSRWLARSVASRVPCYGDGLVVELGGGTGAVTNALLQRGIVPGRLMVIECSAVFVRHLRARFPGVTILHGDAAKLGELLPHGRHIDAIVSGLPLRSLPARKPRPSGWGRWHRGPVHLRLARQRTSVATRLSAPRERHSLGQSSASPRTGVGVLQRRTETWTT
jgi:SAM-dependent methyltransferase